MLRHFSLRNRLTATYAMLLLLMALAALGAFYAAQQGKERLRVVYEERAIPIELLSRLNHLMQRNRVLLMDMLINPGAANIQKSLQEAQANAQGIDQTLKQYLATPKDASLQSLLGRFSAAQSDYQSNGLDKALRAMKDEDFDEAQFVYLNAISSLATPFQSSIDELITSQVDLAGQAYQDATADANTATALSVAMLAVGLVVGVLLSWRVSQSISEPLDGAQRMAARVAEGDLIEGDAISGQDELAHLGHSLEHMRARLARVVSEVRAGSALIALSSAEISNGVSELSTQTDRQVSHLQLARASLEDMLQSIRDYGDVTSRVNMLTKQTNENAKLGGAAVQELIHRIGFVDEKGRKISEITSVIDAIAFQTNILALNAAVEAARAGEQGRGFAVVAQEVRTLAQRSAAAASEIHALVSDAVEAVQQVTSMADETGRRVSAIVAQIESVNSLILQLSDSGQNQSRNLDTVSTAMGQIDEMTRHNAALVEVNAASAISLKNEAAELDQLVGSFRLPMGLALTGGSNALMVRALAP